MLRVQQLLTIK